MDIENEQYSKCSRGDFAYGIDLRIKSGYKALRGERYKRFPLLMLE